jgi:ABC-type branched-subunit amino acid transport system substrate-binding protein
LPDITINIQTEIRTLLDGNYSLAGVNWNSTAASSCPVSSSSQVVSSSKSSTSSTLTNPKMKTIRTGGNDN